MLPKFKSQNGAKQRKNLLVDVGIGSKIASVFIKAVMIVVMVLFMFPAYLLTIRNKKYLFNALKLQRGVITVSNHCYYIDAGLICLSLLPHFAYYGIDTQTMSVPLLSYFLKRLGGFSLEQNNFHTLFSTIEYLLKKNKIVHLFPEGNLLDYNQKVAAFQKGAFYFSLACDAPIVPIAIVLKKRPILKFLTKPFPRVELHLCEPIYPHQYKKEGLNKKEILEKLALDAQQAINDKIKKAQGDYSLFKGKINHHI